MRIKEKTLKEIEALKPDELLIIYDMILTLKSKSTTQKAKELLPSYMRVREALRECKGSMSRDISLAREDRI